jgi:hypothetical protein
MQEVLSGMEEARVGPMVGTVISDIFTSMTLLCGVAVIGSTDGTSVASAGGGSSPEDGISIRLPSIPIPIRMFLPS